VENDPVSESAPKHQVETLSQLQPEVESEAQTEINEENEDKQTQDSADKEENESIAIVCEENMDEKQDHLSHIPLGLRESLSFLTENQQKLAISLCSKEANQIHLFDKWPLPSKVLSPSAEATNKVKVSMMEKLEKMDEAYSGGLLGYISNAKDLLEKSKSGLNPLDGWTPYVPQGETFEIGTANYDKYEKIGLQEIGKCGFVLVAGGLGERLGYSDIKIGLPTELATETIYIQFYIEIILAYQAKYGEGKKLPLCIMTSGDTNLKTVALLEKHDYFGMDKDQINIVIQGDGVPALGNNDARIALDPMNRYNVLAKPHGHGDIHALLHSHDVAKTWLSHGIEWTIFFQDTNGLAFHTLPLALGLSSNLDLIMNSIAVPRKAKQAIGGIALLKNKSGEEKTINVEYNQLDPLLRASGYPDGDINDNISGFSPYPGNINQLVFRLKPYVEALKRTNGLMPEFVNPKYKDTEKTTFKKPTRLECMMQDFPTILEGEESKKVGFTSISADLCFSPVKNATVDGSSLQKKGTMPAVAASGEADQYAAVRKIMQSIGCNIEEADPEIFCGISVIPGPSIVLKPNFVACPGEYKERFTSPSSVTISKSSSLVISGSGVVVDSLDLDGALIINCEEGATGIIRNLAVRNKGWEKVADESNSDEIIRMRGYKMIKNETHTVTIKKDGSIEGSSLDEPYVFKFGDSSPESHLLKKKDLVATEKDGEKLNVISSQGKEPQIQEITPKNISDPFKEDTAEQEPTDQDCGCVIQ